MRELTHAAIDKLGSILIFFVALPVEFVLLLETRQLPLMLLDFTLGMHNFFSETHDL